MLRLGVVHTIVAVAAMGAGATVLLLPKGTRRHRLLGWTYVSSMIALNVTALLIYRLTGRFGPFHIAALASLGTVLAGVWAAVRRRPGGQWLERHYYWMTYSYVGLLAAAVAEVVTRLRLGGFWWVVVIASAGVMAIGSLIVRRQAARSLARFAGRSSLPRSSSR